MTALRIPFLVSLLVAGLVMLTRIAAAVVVIAVLAASGAYLYLRRSLPMVNGAVTVAGIHGPVEIIRDADAIPHVFAGTKADALFGLGYVHAQDRLWQMEFQRRIGFGRLSEIFGAATIPQDRFLRAVGFGRAARAAWAGMSGAIASMLSAVSTSVSPFCTLDAETAMFSVSALRRFSAISNDVRVRVLGS